VQTWPTTFNASFRRDFAVTDQNPDPQRFSPVAAADFTQTVAALYGEQALAATPILYCHKQSENANVAFKGTGLQLLQLLATKREVAEMMDIVTLKPAGFVCRYSTRRGGGGVCEMSLTPLQDVHVLYRKQGWETMVCTKLLAQFVQEGDLH
jgi:hypothetical protein